MKNKIAIIILTFNSEKIIKRTIKAAKKISKEIIILDSFSTDRTIEVVKNLKCKVYKKNISIILIKEITQLKCVINPINGNYT